MIIPSSKHEVTSENASVRLLCSFSRCCQPSCCPPMTSKRGFTFCTLSKGIWNLARNIRRIVPQKCQLIIKQGCTCSLLASCSQKRMRMIGTGINFIKHIRKPERNCRDLPGEFLYYRHGPCFVGGHDAFKPTQPFGRKTCMGISNLQNGWVSKLLCFGDHEPPPKKKKTRWILLCFQGESLHGIEHVCKSRKASRLRSIENLYTLKKGQPNPDNQFNCSSTMCAKRR